jgi:hypothetical protein
MADQQNIAAPNSGTRWHVTAMLALFAVTLLSYAATLGHGFIYFWDDYKYVVDNWAIQGITPAHFAAIFSNYYVGNYAPLHLISYMIDYQLWGLDPRGYHFVNILLHALNGLLVYRLLIKVELPNVPALFGASLFALHPVQVESVAWVSERKNVLAAFFFLLALLAYIDYRTVDIGHRRNYLLSLVFFVCALLSKSAAVIFPLVVICYDRCHGPGSHAGKMVDKLPFLLLGLVAGVVTVFSQNPGVSIGSSDYPGGNILTAAWTMLPVIFSYLKDLFYPFELSPYYIVPIRKTIDLNVMLAACALLGLGWAVAITFRRRSWMFFFSALFFIALLPVLQLIPLLSTLKNDRYLYFPMIGAAGMAALALAALLRMTSRLRNVTVALTVVICAVLGGASYYQSLIWKDNLTLWRHAISRDPDNMLAWLMMAKGYTQQGNVQAAMRAITIYDNLKLKHGPLRGWEGIGS